MNGLSTRDTAKKLGISFTSLNRYIAAKKVPLPPVVRVGGVRVRLWSDNDIARARDVLPKIANGRKTRYKKKGSKKQASKKVSNKMAGKK